MGKVAHARCGGPPFSRRTFLAAAAAAGAGLATADLPAAGAGPGSAASKGAANTLGQLAGWRPDYVPLNLAKPDFPAVTGPAGVPSPPGYLQWPAKQVRAITSPVASGAVTAMTPAWWAI